MGQIKPQASQTLLLWMSYFSRLTAALHGPVCCPHSTYQVIFISRMAGHTKICATTAQTNQRHKALSTREKTHTRTNFELQPLFSESQAVTPHSKRTNLPAYQRTIEGPLWPVIYCERHIPTSKSRKPLYPSKPQSLRWHVQGIIVSTALQFLKERKNKRNKLVLESFGHLSPGQSERPAKHQPCFFRMDVVPTVPIHEETSESKHLLHSFY